MTNTPCVIRAPTDFFLHCQTGSLNLAKGHQWHSCVSDASLWLKNKFIHSIKTLQFLLLLMSKNKYWLHIFGTTLFCLWAQRVTCEYLHFPSTFKLLHDDCSLNYDYWKKKLPWLWSFIFTICNYCELEADLQGFVSLFTPSKAFVRSCACMCLLVMHHAFDRWLNSRCQRSPFLS